MAKEGIRSRKKNDKNIHNEEMGSGGWVDYMAAKRAKLLEQFHGSEIKEISNIFKGVAIHVNGLTTPPMNELKDLMAAHGGVFHGYQVSSTTHLIASNLANVKIKHLGSVPVVKPSWITDSIHMGKLLEYQKYLLYTNNSKTQPKIQFPVVEKVSELPDVDITEKSTSDIPETPQLESDGVKKKDTFCPEQSINKPPVKTASDPKFLEEFYNNSRLHLISTLGAEFKRLVGEMRINSNGQFPGMKKLSLTKGQTPSIPVPDTVIMHIDMDCFFVSVGLRNNPHLRGKPVAITHARNGQLTYVKPKQEANRKQEFTMYSERLAEGVHSRVDKLDTQSSMSEIASCSYEARKCGVKNGMFLGQAVKLCPDLKTLPYDFEGYRNVSNILYKTIASYTLDIEAVSCDEMYVDVTSILKGTGLSVDEWASHIRNEILEVTGCPCSTGFGANRLQARLATRKAKPAGQYYLQPYDVEMYMAQIPLSDLPGVGRATLAKLKNLGLITCGDVQLTSWKVLQSEIGHKAGETLKEQSRGIDHKPLNYCHERKSVSAEVNYGIRFKTLDECHDFLQRLSDEVYNRLNDINMRARCLTLKLMVRASDAPEETAKYLGHGICDSLSKSKTNIIINNPEIIFKETKALYEKLNPPFADLRGVGIQLSKLEKIAIRSTAFNNFLKLPTDKNVEKHEKQKESAVEMRDENILPASVNKEVAAKQPVVKLNRGSRRDKNNCDAKKKATSKPLTDFFGKTKNREMNDKYKEYVPAKNQIDFNVLKELPEELRQEIMRDYNLETVLPCSSVVEPIQTEHKVVSQEQYSENERLRIERRPFSNLTCEQLRPVIEKWTQSADDPVEIDIEMIANHFKELALDRKIESLKSVFSFLHRLFSQLNCNWHSAYFKIVNIMQEGMVARYGGTLMVMRNFQCCKK